MGLRETLNKNPALTTGATIAATVLAIGLIAWQLRPAPAAKLPTHRYYTIDDGQNWFSDLRPPGRLPPFKKDGKDAVIAHVYQYGTEKPFVLYMEKYNDKALAALTQFYSDPNNKDKPHGDLYEDTALMIKTPNKPWVQKNYQIIDRILSLPEKNGQIAHEILPE